MKTYKIAAIPGDGIGTEVVDAGVEVLKALAQRDGSFAFQFDHFDWGGEYYKKHGRMMPEDGARLRSGTTTRSCSARPAHPEIRGSHHAVGSATGDLPAVRPIRQRAADANPARHHLAAARGIGPGTGLGDRTRELRR